MKRLILSICLIFSYNLTGKDYLDTLSDDSLIKKKCHTCSKSWIPFHKNKVEKACDDLEKKLKAFDADEQKSISGTSGLGALVMAGNEEALHALIRIILEDETDEVKFKECDKVKDAAEKIKAKRIKRLEAQKQEEENLKKNPPRKF